MNTSDVYARLDPYASATATLRGGDPLTDAALPRWSEEFNEELEFEEKDGANAPRDLLFFGAVQYFARALASPFEVGLILKQVQFLPSDAYLDRFGDIRGAHRYDSGSGTDAEAETNDDDSHSDSDIDMDGIIPSEDSRSYVNSVLDVRKAAAADASGYLLTTYDDDEPTRAPYQLPPLEGSVWETIGEIVWKDGEGLLSLWKGQTPTWLESITYSLLRPTLSTHLTTLIHSIDPPDFTDSTTLLLHDALPPIASTVLTRFLLQPFSLIRTRLIVQTAHPYHRKYRGPLHCLSTIIAEEGASTLLFGKHTLPSLLSETVSATLTWALGVVRASVAEMQEAGESTPFSALATIVGLTALELAITIPLDTITHRLQCQISTRRPQERAFETCVERSPIPYTGMLDCAVRILTEEGGPRSSAAHIKNGRRRRKGSKHHHDGAHARPRRRRSSAKNSDTHLATTPTTLTTRVKTWWRSWGVRGLYRGFRLRLMSAVVMAVAASLEPGLEEDAVQF